MKSRPDVKRGIVRRTIPLPGDDLLSHPVSRAVPSALEGLTSVFGMGTGVSPPLWSPGRDNITPFFPLVKGPPARETHLTGALRFDILMELKLL